MEHSYGRQLAVVVVALLSSGLCWAQPARDVRVWEDQLTLPTYVLGPPEPNPFFFFGRASQGAEGRVYPYPLYDHLTYRKEPRSYRVVYLENEYVRVMVAPELGGRLFEAIDKTNGYHFIYRQHVIKPALIGLIGAWISGGIEWNIPHHHRATTMLPVQYHIEQNPDGSKTVWVGELEPRHRMRWAVGYTLYPGRSYLEAKVRVVNRTPVVHTMLCWANVAVHVNENYQIIFPPRTQWGTHHHKREFVEWPIARRRYGGADFSSGVDVSWYKNHVASNSIFAWNYEDDFFAGYDHGKRAGIISVADHHIVPGKKLWTWGTGPRGQMWDKILTDEDGPYVELMVGAYSDNQPDYSWLQPFETKAFEMYWYPFREIGGVKNANLNGAVNLEISGSRAKLGFYTPQEHRSAEVMLKAGNRVLFRETIAIGPAKPYVREVVLPAGIDEHSLRASLLVAGKELVGYTPIRLEPQPMPKPVEPPPPPQEIKTNEELYLTGLRIEQFHHPTLEPDPYWEEALRRDPGDVRVNTALGINYLKKARFAEAERLFRKALERLTDRYTTPKDAEPLYYLGLALKAQGKQEEAFRYCYSATWSLQWRAAGYYCLAEISTARGEWEQALNFVDRSLEANALNVRALALKASLLRQLGRGSQALALLSEAQRRTDPLDVRYMAEEWLASREETARARLLQAMTEHPLTSLELAADYMNAGLWSDGKTVLQELVTAAAGRSKVSPLVHYYLGYMAEKLGDDAQANGYYQQAAKGSPEYVFPFQWETIPVLERAMTVNPKDARAPYYLGNLLFDWQPERAQQLWERSAALDDTFPIVYRNLALAYARASKGADLNKAIQYLEKAVSLPQKYALHFAELDALYEAAGVEPGKRLAMLERNHEVVQQRDDALAREITLKVVLGKWDEAIQLMSARRFSVWEGGSIRVADDWIDAHLLRGQQHLAAGRLQEALHDFESALHVPENLPAERRFEGARQAEIRYWLGVVYEALGKAEFAREQWRLAVAAPLATRRALETLLGTESYYRARALQKLGQVEEARQVFQSLLDAGKRALEGAAREIDFFASFGEQQSQRQRLATAHYLAGLGYLGLGDRAQAREEFEQVLRYSPDHLGARTQLASLKTLAQTRQ